MLFNYMWIGHKTATGMHSEIPCQIGTAGGYECPVPLPSLKIVPEQQLFRPTGVLWNIFLSSGLHLAWPHRELFTAQRVYLYLQPIHPCCCALPLGRFKPSHISWRCHWEERCYLLRTRIGMPMLASEKRRGGISSTNTGNNGLTRQQLSVWRA